MKKYKTLLLGSYGRGNLGDDAFLWCLKDLFDDQDHPFVINCANRDDLPIELQDVDSIDTTFESGFLDKIKIFLSLENIIYGGGDLWVELYGDKFPRISLYKMILVNLVARLFGKKIFYFGCGVGKLTGYSLLLARISAKLANTVLVRDSHSAKKLNLPVENIASDLTSLLLKTKTYKFNLRPSLIKKKPVIGISVMYYIPNPDVNFTSYLRSIANFINDNEDKYSFVLIPLLESIVDKRDDVYASEELNKLLNKELHVFRSNSILLKLNRIENLDYMLGTRLHANILSILLNVPAFGIAYRQKITSFFSEIEQDTFQVSIDNLCTLDSEFSRFITDMTDKNLTNPRKILFENERYIETIRKIF